MYCLLLKNFGVYAFSYCSQLNKFSLVWNIMWLSTSPLMPLVCPHSMHILLRGSCIWLIGHAMYKFNRIFHGCFRSRHIMTRLTLGPLAFKYPYNIIVLISFSFSLEFAFVAEELSWTTPLCKSFLTIITVKRISWMCSINLIFNTFYSWRFVTTLVTFHNSFMYWREKMACLARTPYHRYDKSLTLSSFMSIKLSSGTLILLLSYTPSYLVASLC